jgi:hypothetical protein
MDRNPETDPEIRLPRDVYYVLIHTLRGILPPPVVDTPEEIARRDNAAIAQVAAMLPANADEANLAAVCVGARTYGMDCLRQARALTLADPMAARRCSAEAASMMRESRQARSLLLRLQTVREQREKDSAATNRAAWSEHCSIGLMTRALAEAPPEPEPPAPEPPAPAEAETPRRDRAGEAELGGLPDPDLVHTIVTGTSPELRALGAEASHQAVT